MIQPTINQQKMSFLIPFIEVKYNKPKRIKVWLNNESSCHKIFIDPKELQSWNFILHHITKLIYPYFGPINRLVGLRNKKVVTDFEELDPHEKYIALGPHCKLMYDSSLYRTNSEVAMDLGSRRPKRYFYSTIFDSKIIPFLKITKKKHLTIVFIAINGNSTPPYKIVFKDSELKNWEFVRTYLSQVMGIIDGVQYIYTIFGDELATPEEFQHGCLYVAVPYTEKFKEMDYAKLLGEKNKSSFHKIEQSPKETLYDIKLRELKTKRRRGKSLEPYWHSGFVNSSYMIFQKDLQQKYSYNEEEDIEQLETIIAVTDLDTDIESIKHVQENEKLINAILPNKADGDTEDISLNNKDVENRFQIDINDVDGNGIEMKAIKNSGIEIKCVRSQLTINIHEAEVYDNGNKMKIKDIENGSEIDIKDAENSIEIKTMYDSDVEIGIQKEPLQICIEEIVGNIKELQKPPEIEEQDI